MKIAVPLFGDRVSPHFGASREVLLVETRNGKISRKTVVNIGADDVGRMARYLASWDVNRIVCGGIQQIQKRWLTDNGIEVVDNQKGPAEELLNDMISSEWIREKG